MAEFTGILHVHSTFSDGAMSLAEIRNWAVAEQLDFVCISDHSEHLSSDRRGSLIDECARLSRKVLLVPGIEFAHSGRHVIVHGPRECLMEATDEDAVCRPETVRDRGGMTIWAHPALTYALSLREGAAAPYDGWEIWNLKVDGAFLNPAIASQFRQIAREQGVLPFAGWDAHTNPPPESGPLTVITSGATQLTEAGLLQSLGNAQYRIQGEQVGSVDVQVQTPTVPLWQATMSRLHHRRTRAGCVARYLAHTLKAKLRL